MCAPWVSLGSRGHFTASSPSAAPAAAVTPVTLAGLLPGRAVTLVAFVVSVQTGGIAVLQLWPVTSTV